MIQHVYRYHALPSKENSTVRLTAGASITAEIAEPVKDAWVLSLLNENIRDRMVQVCSVKSFKEG